MKRYRCGIVKKYQLGGGVQYRIAGREPFYRKRPIQTDEEEVSMPRLNKPRQAPLRQQFIEEEEKRLDPEKRKRLLQALIDYEKGLKEEEAEKREDFRDPHHIFDMNRPWRREQQFNETVRRALAEGWPDNTYIGYDIPTPGGRALMSLPAYPNWRRGDFRKVDQMEDKGGYYEVYEYDDRDNPYDLTNRMEPVSVFGKTSYFPYDKYDQWRYKNNYPEGQGVSQYYVAQEGDTYDSVARRFGLSPEQVRQQTLPEFEPKGYDIRIYRPEELVPGARVRVSDGKRK